MKNHSDEAPVKYTTTPIPEPNNDPLALELVGVDLQRYLEISRLRKMIDPTGRNSAAWNAMVESLKESAPAFDGDEITPDGLEAYARQVLGAPERTDRWLTRDQWEIVILFCHERLSVREAACRCLLSEEGIQRRWKRTRRRIKHFSQIASIVDVDGRELFLGV